jgi:hypothetical protein
MHLHITHRFMTFCIIYQLGVEVVRDKARAPAEFRRPLEIALLHHFDLTLHSAGHSPHSQQQDRTPSTYLLAEI